jgi:hypothetical protein
MLLNIRYRDLKITMKALISALILPFAFSQTGTAQATAANSNESSLYVKVQLDKSVKLSSLKPGDVTEGSLARDVYSADHRVFPAGSHVRLTVDHLERQRRVANDHWPWVVRFFTPRHQNVPSFKDAAISGPDGAESLLQVSLISASRRTELHAQPAKRRKKDDGATISMGSAPPSSDAAPRPPRNRSEWSLGPIMSFEAREEGINPHSANPDSTSVTLLNPITLPAGTACKILLLRNISASKSHAGDVVQARLLDPVVLDSQVVLPAGSLFEGSVVKARPPRWLSRAGSLSLTFTSLLLPDGDRVPVTASLAGVEVDRRSHTKIDAEGQLHGDRPGVAWMLINGGVTAGIAKEVDDGTQLIMEALLSGATDASTAGTARIAGTIVSSIFLLTRHGRDVVLPNLTEMNIMLDRPLTLSGQVASAAPNP